MTDLIERLRHDADTMCPGQYYDRILNEAADRIEQLEGVRDAFMSNKPYVCAFCSWSKDTATWAEAEAHMYACELHPMRALRAKVEQLERELAEREKHRQQYVRQSEADADECEALRADAERLMEEIYFLRQYGNKDCTAMADAARAAKGE